VVFSTLRNGTWRNDLIKRLITGDHAEIAAGALFERLHAVLQITYFGCELPIALAKLVVFGSLRRDCRIETTQLADTVFGKPYTVLQEHHDDEQRCGKPLHERGSLSDVVPRAKRVRRMRRTFADGSEAYVRKMAAGHFSNRLIRPPR
jgi:hypothetical protein